MPDPLDLDQSAAFSIHEVPPRDRPVVGLLVTHDGFVYGYLSAGISHPGAATVVLAPPGVDLRPPEAQRTLLQGHEARRLAAAARDEEARRAR